jgi:hypothetical protein
MNTALLFTTENDITFSIKKRVGTIIEQAPTLKKRIGCHSRNERKGFQHNLITNAGFRLENQHLSKHSWMNW